MQGFDFAQILITFAKFHLNLLKSNQSCQKPAPTVLISSHD